MPYDPRPISEGGNRGIDQPDEPGGFSRNAPEGKFRIVGVDTFDGGDWVYKDVDTLEEAKEFAAEKVKENPQMFKVHVYNDQGKHVHQGGTF